MNTTLLLILGLVLMIALIWALYSSQRSLEREVEAFKTKSKRVRMSLKLRHKINSHRVIVPWEHYIFGIVVILILLYTLLSHLEIL